MVDRSELTVGVPLSLGERLGCAEVLLEGESLGDIVLDGLSVEVDDIDMRGETDALEELESEGTLDSLDKEESVGEDVCEIRGDEDRDAVADAVVVNAFVVVGDLEGTAEEVRDARLEAVAVFTRVVVALALSLTEVRLLTDA